MNDEIGELRSQLEQLSDEFRAAQRTISKLESRKSWQRPNLASIIVLVAAAALFTGFWNAKASSGFDHSSLTSDTPPTKVKAPFEVDDDNGIPIMIVRDQANQDANVGRGVYVIDQARKDVVRMGTTDDDGGGGMILVTETGSKITSTGGQVNGIQISGTQEKATIQVIRGGKKVASMGAEQADKGGVESGGSVQLYGANEKPIATLSKGKNGGELNVYDTKNKKGATLGTDTVGGLLSIYSSGDKPRVTVGADANGGTVNIFGSGEKPVATLKSNGGNGKMSIGDNEGNPVVEAVADETGGYVKVLKKGDDKTYTSINAIAAGTGLKVKKGGIDTVFAGAGSEGGVLNSYNAAGDLVTTVSTLSGRGLIGVIAKEKVIAFLTESDKHPGGGNVTTTNPAGEGIFSAGFTGEGGDACINRKTGLKCLGINLPLQISP